MYGGHPAPLWWFLPLPGDSWVRQDQKKEEIASAFLPILPPSLTHTMPFCPCGPPHPSGPGLSWVEAVAREPLSSQHLPPVWLCGVSLVGRLGVASRAARVHLGGAEGVCLFPPVARAWAQERSA